jgi:hypothetical protein
MSRPRNRLQEGFGPLYDKVQITIKEPGLTTRAIDRGLGVSIIARREEAASPGAPGPAEPDRRPMLR